MHCFYTGVCQARQTLLQYLHTVNTNGYVFFQAVRRSKIFVFSMSLDARVYLYVLGLNLGAGAGGYLYIPESSENEVCDRTSQEPIHR